MITTFVNFNNPVSYNNRKETKVKDLSEFCSLFRFLIFFSFSNFFANFSYTAKVKHITVMSEKIYIQTYKFQTVKISKSLNV